MNGSFVLDTNIIIPILNRDSELLKRIENLNLYIPVIALGELHFGARKSGQVAANLTRIETFKTRCTILTCDENTATEYGHIKELLQTKGRLIPENDIWIAAIAKRYQLPLASRDEHFNFVDDLKVEKW